jgi:hypothetical protein
VTAPAQPDRPAACSSCEDIDPASCLICRGTRQPEPDEFTEYGYLGEWPDGFRCAVSPLGADREQALQHFRTYEPETRGERLVFVSRRITRSGWADEEDNTDG